MTEPMAADDLCEHHYETRILGGQPITVGACIFCRTPDWADLREQAAELYRWGWQEGRDGKGARERLSAYDKPQLAATEATEPATITDPEWLRQQYAAAIQPLLMDNLPKPIAAARARDVADTVLFVRDRHLVQLRQRLELADVDLADTAAGAARLHRLRGQLAAEHAKVVAADQQPRPDLDHLRVTPHNGIAAGLQTAIFFVDHHLREVNEEDRTTPDNPATSSDTADNPLRADAEAWRHKAVRRALAISKLRGTIDACTDLADEPVTDRTPWGDGYRAAIGDLREVLREFGHLEPAAAAEPGEQP